MTQTRRHRVVLVTAPNLRVARQIARAVLEARVAACANLVPRIESHYWWKGVVETGLETLLVFKTERARLKRLERVVLLNHPYETPEFVVLPIEAGSKPYLDWISENVRSVGKTAGG